MVVTTQEQYPQDILVEFTKDNCETLNNYKVGDEVEVGINLRGREWTSPQGEVKYFNTIQGWKIGTAQAEVTVEAHSPFDHSPLGVIVVILLVNCILCLF